MWRLQGKFRINWDLLIMILAIWNWLQVPYGIAFTLNNNESPLEQTFNQLCNLIFILDVIFSFRTTYINEETGIEVTSGWKIAAQYLKGNIPPLFFIGRFLIDLLASIPTDTVRIYIIVFINHEYIIDKSNDSISK